MKSSFINFPNFFRKYWRHPAGRKFYIFSTCNNFITGCMWEQFCGLSISTLCWGSWLWEKLLTSSFSWKKKKPLPLPLCWLLSLGPDRTGRLTWLVNWFIILGFLCKSVNIDSDFYLALIIFESFSSNFFPNKWSLSTASKFNIASFSISFWRYCLSKYW